MSHVDYFKRSDTQFFHAQRTHRAISALAKASCLDVRVASMVEIVSVLRAAGRDLLTLEELVPNTA
jgi:hypothetical protein